MTDEKLSMDSMIRFAKFMDGIDIDELESMIPEDIFEYYYDKKTNSIKKYDFSTEVFNDTIDINIDSFIDILNKFDFNPLKQVGTNMMENFTNINGSFDYQSKMLNFNFEGLQKTTNKLLFSKIEKSSALRQISEDIRTVKNEDYKYEDRNVYQLVGYNNRLHFSS